MDPVVPHAAVENCLRGLFPRVAKSDSSATDTLIYFLVDMNDRIFFFFKC